MILKISSEKYYGHQGRTKELFKRKYRSLKLKWKANINLGGVLSDGWFNDSNSIYLLKLPEEDNMKRFTGNSISMIEFLKMHGAIECEEYEKGTHFDYDSNKGYMTQNDRYGGFIGGDLLSGYRFGEMLKDAPLNWGCVWSDKNNVSQIGINTFIKKKVIVRRR